MGELSNTTINGVSYDFKDAGAARQSHSHTKSQITDFPTSMPASDVSAWAKASSKPSYTASEVGAIATTAKGAASGVAELDANGKVPSSQLPSFVDDVLEYSAKSSFPATGETGKIYVDTTTNKTYRWSGSAYVEISPSLALGETSSTAYRGDRGKTAYDHSQVTSGNPHNVTKADVGLNNVGNFKAVSTVASQGLSSTEKANARANIGAGTGNGTYSKPSGGIPKTDLASGVQTSLGLADGALQHTTVSGSPDLDKYLTTGVYHITTSTATHAPTTNHATLFVDATVGTPYQIFKPDNVDSPWYTRHRSGSSWTAWAAMKFTDTTYSAATTSAAGLMSATDKSKLDGLPNSPSGYTKFSTVAGSDVVSSNETGGFINYGNILFVHDKIHVGSGTSGLRLFSIVLSSGDKYPLGAPLSPIPAEVSSGTEYFTLRIPVYDSSGALYPGANLHVSYSYYESSSRARYTTTLWFDTATTSNVDVLLHYSYMGELPTTL